MEESRPPVTNNEEKNSPAIERKQGFLVSFQDRLHELLGTEKPDKDPASKKESDSSSEKDPSGGRFRRLWGKLFGNIASAELIEEPEPKETPTEDASPLDRLVGWDNEKTSHPEDTPDTRAAEATTPGPIHSEVPSATTPNVRTVDEVLEQQETEVEASQDDGYMGETIIPHDDEESLPAIEVQHAPQEIAPIIPPRWEGPSQESVAEMREPTPLITPTEIVTPALHYEDMQRREAGDLTPTPAHVAEERVRERDEQRLLDRKRDEQTRKLKRQMKKRQDQTVEAIKQEIKRSNTGNVAEQQVERVGGSTPLIERTPETTVNAPRSNPEKTVPSSEKMDSKTSEQTSPTAVEQLRGIPEGRESKERPSEHVLERVVEAAEHNEPIEKRFEQRHEIKDSESVTRNPVPVGAIMPSSYEKYAEQVQMSMGQSNKELAQKLAAQTASPPTRELYASAVRWGFWSAIALIVLGLIAYRVVG